jgi:anti-sigma factor RsiW
MAMMVQRDQLEHEVEGVEALLPWHAAGTLSARDARRVEDALARDPALARQFAAIREELAETIHLNESLGAPSVRAMDRLFAAIDAEPARRPSVARGWSTRLSTFMGALSPRALAFSASAAAVLLLVQAGVIGTVLFKQQAGPAFQTASAPAKPGSAGKAAASTELLVSFKPEARAADIAAFLATYQAAIVDGPKAGMFRLRLGQTVAAVSPPASSTPANSMTNKSKATETKVADTTTVGSSLDRLIARIEREAVISAAVAAD